MKTQIFVLLAMLAYAAARPQQGKDAILVKSNSENNGEEGYNFSFETSDPITRQEVGTFKQVQGVEEPVITVTGTFSWKDESGKTYTVEYVADERGYRPKTTIS